MPVASAAQEGGRGVRVFMARRIQEGLVILPQELGQADFHRAIARKAADAVLTLHPLGKAQANGAGIDAEAAVQPVIFFP